MSVSHDRCWKHALKWWRRQWVSWLFGFKKPTDRAPSISTWRYTRGPAEDASAESMSPSEAVPIDLAPIKTEHSESSYRISTSMCADGRGGLTIVTKPNPHESNPDRLDPSLHGRESGSCGGALETPVQLFLHASSVEHASSNLRLVSIRTLRR